MQLTAFTLIVLYIIKKYVEIYRTFVLQFFLQMSMSGVIFVMIVYNDNVMLQIEQYFLKIQETIM